MKRSHTSKGYTSTYNVKILNSFNPDLQFKDAECAIKNKLIASLNSLQHLLFKLKTQFLMKVTLMMYLNQCIVLLYQT